MSSLSVRSYLALTLAALHVIAAGVLASFAYRSSQESLTHQAVATSQIVAGAREEALARTLERQHDRIRAFTGSVESLCGERTPARTIAWERECVHVALSGFQTAERAWAVELRYGPRRVAMTGTWPKTVAFPSSDRVAAIGSAGAADVYTVQATRGRVVVRVIYPLADLATTFRDRSGLDMRGEVFLTDATGRVLMPTGVIAAEFLGSAPANEVLARCRAGESNGLLVDGVAGAGLIAGFQPVTAIGGGCVVARLDYDEALGPIHRLGRLFLLVAGGFVLVVTLLSVIVARAVTRPIARLAAAAHDLEAGRFDRAVPVSGPREVRQLGGALSRMARSLGDLVHREHDARLEAETANRMKDDFLATLSHELRTPLTAIMGWVSILRNQPRDPARTEHALRVIDRNARAEAGLIEDLLDVSRIVNGQLRLNLADVSPTAVVDAALESVRPAAEIKGVALSTHVEGAVADVVGDPRRLQQIVWNLVSNAVRFTPQGGRVDITVRQSGHTTELRVSDTGVGIAPELLPHVFERFRQGETGTTRAYGGLGLGLAIVRHLVELHGGSVRAESAGRELGSTFIVTLPMAAGRTAVARAPASGMADVNLAGTRVLVVDDDPDTREVLREILEEAGASVATSATARETRALIDRLDPDVLIADIGMPEEDGYSLIRSVRAGQMGSRHLPAIALSAHARAEDVERALESGFETHVAKPVDSSRLLSTIATLVCPAA
jgi:signal transduction histidine kinase/CheY-like chemotaxis protein